MKKILTCTDGSLYAPSVYALSAWAARQTGAAVHLLHVLDAERERAHTSDWSGNIGISSRETLLRQLVELEEMQGRLAREKGALILNEAVQQLKNAGVAQVSAEQQHGALVEAVTRLETDADLVVIGKRGQAADFAKGHLGSNLERVVRASTRPVLVAARKFVPITRCLIAFDGGPSARKAIHFMAQTPLLKGVPCTLVRAGRIDAEAESSLHDAAAILRHGGLEVDLHTREGEAEQVIAARVQEEDAQLLVMGAYGHSRIRHLIIGSTTTAMIRTCQIPVLLFR